MSATFQLRIEESPREAGSLPDRIVTGRWEGQPGSRSIQMLTLLNALFDAWDGPRAPLEGRLRATGQAAGLSDADV